MPTHNPSRKRYIRPRIKTKVVERYVSDLPMVATEACLLDATMVTTKAIQRRLEDHRTATLEKKKNSLIQGCFSKHWSSRLLPRLQHTPAVAKEVHPELRSTFSDS